MKKILYIICLFILIQAVDLFAQISRATVNGKIIDNEGEPVPAAAVMVEDLDAGLTRGTTTDEKGVYTLVGLLTGNYVLKVQHLTYHPQERNINLSVGQTLTLDFKLIPKSLEIGTVEVVSEATFELKKSDVSSSVRNEQIMELPLDSRSVLNLGAITPGVKSYGGSYPSSGAVSSYNFVNLYVNGSEWKSQYNGNIVGLGQTASPLPQDAIQEFKVIHNAYDAEYTRGGSVLISAVTKRGTNRLKGTGFFTLQNKDLTNRGPFQTTVPDRNRKQGGLSLSGPIIQDKFFFSGTYELNDAVNILTVNPGKPAYNPGIWSSYGGDFESPRTTHLAATKLTFQANENNIFDLSWNYRNTESKFYFGGTYAYQAGLFGQYSVNDIMLEHTHIFSSHATNELSLQYLNWRHDEPTISEGPTFVYPSINLGRATFPIQLKEDHFTFLNKFTYNFGNHLFKAGVKVTNLNAEPWFPYYKDGEFTFRTDTSALPYEGTIGLGLVNSNSTDDARGESSGWALGAFIQDGWRVSDQLTLDLGVRWDADLNMLNNDYTVRWANDPVITSNISDEYINRGDRKNQLTNFSPRINVNYDLFNNGLTYLRGGYGVFYDRTVGYIGYFEYLYSNWGMYTIQNPGTTDPNVLRQMVLSGQGTARPSVYMVHKEIETPKINQWSLGISHQFTEKLAGSIDYVNKYYSNIFKAYNANYYKPSISSRILTTNYGDIWLYDSFGESWWYGFLTSVSYRSPAWYAQLAYTLSWAYTTNDGISYNLLELFYKKRSTYDERHRFVLNFSVNLPFGFQFGGIGTIATPVPYNVYIGQDLNDNNNFTDDWIRGGEVAVPSASMIRNWYKMLDLRLTKYFSYNQFRAGLFFEAYNVGNWFNASSYYPRMADASGNLFSNFGRPTAAYLARTMQLGLRLFLD
jgi:hypothetical protein